MAERVRFGGGGLSPEFSEIHLELSKAVGSINALVQARVKLGENCILEVLQEVFGDLALSNHLYLDL